MKTGFTSLAKGAAALALAVSAIAFCVGLAFVSQTVGGAGNSDQSGQALALLSISGILLILSVRAVRLARPPRINLEGWNRPRVARMGDPQPGTRHYDHTGSLWGGCVSRFSSVRPLIRQ